VSTPVAIRAHQIALLDFDPDPCPRDAALADLELLRAGVTVMELERGKRRVVPAVRASPAPAGDELGLQLPPLLLLIAIRLDIPPLAAMFDEIAR